jgi:hypothetical protein
VDAEAVHGHPLGPELVGGATIDERASDSP